MTAALHVVEFVGFLVALAGFGWLQQRWHFHRNVQRQQYRNAVRREAGRRDRAGR